MDARSSKGQSRLLKPVDLAGDQPESPLVPRQFEYGFDDIGNRSSTKAGGDQSGAGLRPSTYTANSLNQYTSRTVPNAFDVLGIANVSSSVTVNTSAADYRRGEYFHELVGVNNSSTSVWQNVSVTTSGGGSASGNVWVAKTPENYGPDLDGNQTSDGRWNYTWDAENRLIRMVANTATGPQQRIDLEYDWKGRRIGKKVWNNTGGTGTPATYLKFVYDGWNLIAELDGNNANALKRSFIWGLDLSGQSPLSVGAGGGLQGAGGVGGLLAIKPASGSPTFVAYDGNGNVIGLIDATTGTIAGNFEYGPFGETIRLTPNSNNQSPFRFSTKYTDDESDFLYYGFRYYAPSLGRWLSRDPLGEKGGNNLFRYVANAPTIKHDRLGLAVAPPEPPDSPREPEPGKPIVPDKRKPIKRWCVAYCYGHVFGVVCDIGEFVGSPPDQKALDACLSEPSRSWDTECHRQGGPIRSRMMSICDRLRACFQKHWPQTGGPPIKE